VLYKKVDEYVDSLAPQIQPRIATELELFQQKTIDSLETQVIDAFRSLFNKGSNPAGDARNLNDAPPNAYGGTSLPFADEIAKLTQSFGKITDGANDDLRDIFDITEGRGGAEQSRSQNPESSGGARGFLSSALNAVQDHLEKNNNGPGGGQGFEVGGLLGVLSDTLKDASRNPEEKARLISPEIKDRVAEKLRAQHTSIAEQFTRIALEHVKRWLRSNTSSRDVGDGAKAEIEDQVKDLVKGIGGLFGSKRSSNEESSRGIEDAGRDGGGGGFQRVISDKLSTGLARVHREVRLEFRKILGAIEKQLFELLPDQFQKPLERILGGNPFDSQLDRDANGQNDRGFGDDLKAKLINKIRALVAKVQETLRESILGVVNGGHRKFERESWVFVQDIVEQKVQRYLPDVKISVPDDIGNEGVSVGTPTQNTQMGGGTQSSSSAPQGEYNNNQPPQGQYSEHERPQSGYNPSSPRDNYQNNAPPSGQYGGHDQPQSGYSQPPQYQDNQGYQNEPYGQNQNYQSQQQGYQSYQNQQHSDRPDQYSSSNQNYPQQSNSSQDYYQQGPPGGGYQQNYQPRY